MPSRNVVDRAYRRAYQRAMALWPAPRQEVELATPFGATRGHLHLPAEPSGAPFVLLNGKNGHASQWHPLVPALAASGRPVLALDTPGDPGLSRPEPDRPLRAPEDFAAWLDAAVAAALPDAARVHLVGRSYGGWISLAAAMHAPKRLASVALLDPAGLAAVPPRFFAWMLACGAAAVLPRAVRAPLARPLRNPTTAQGRPLAACRAGVLAHAARPGLPVPRPYRDEELREAAASGVPALFVLGGHSPLNDPRRVLPRIGMLMPDAAATVVPRAGHVVDLVDPARAAALLGAFAQHAERQRAC
ncbi:alpha/beta fold hydrolase [Mangrovactinospora gilvigrisea]|nr:alpha/beta fold hydrolase [Mangrovactinospora gilvigrisea]